MFHNYRDAVPRLDVDPPRVRTVRLLQTDEELQSAIDRARAFERRDNYVRRVGTYDRYLNLLANVVSMPSEDIDEEVHPPAAS